MAGSTMGVRLIGFFTALLKAALTDFSGQNISRPRLVAEVGFFVGGALQPVTVSRRKHKGAPQMKQRLLVMNGQRIVQTDQCRAWANQKVDKAGALKPGISYNAQGKALVARAVKLSRGRSR